MSPVKLTHTMTFSEEQSMLLDTATEFFREKSPISGVRDLMLSEHGYPPEVWQEMVALGWSGLAIPESHGGSGLGLAAAVTIAEPMGRYLSATPWLPTQLFIQGVLAGGEQALHSSGKLLVPRRMQFPMALEIEPIVDVQFAAVAVIGDAVAITLVSA